MRVEPTFVWPEYAGAKAYRIEISQQSDFRKSWFCTILAFRAKLVTVRWESLLFHTNDDLPELSHIMGNGTFYWRVDAITSDGTKIPLVEPGATNISPAS